MEPITTISAFRMTSSPYTERMKVDLEEYQAAMSEEGTQRLDRVC